MAFEEFRCIVIGNEPAGLWLLSALERECRALGEEPRLGWLSLGAEPPPVCFPTQLGQSFGVTPAAPWSAEVLNPRHSLTWDAKSLAEKYPQLPPIDTTRDALTALQQPTAAETTAMRAAIAQAPELISFAQGMCKALGRNQEAFPESAVQQARFLTGLSWWSPEKELSPSIQRITLSTSANPMEGFKAVRPEGMAIRFQDFGEVVSRKWILNLDLRTLKTLCQSTPTFLDVLNLDLNPATMTANFAMPILVEPEAIPAPVKPLTVWFDTDLIPDIATETWPMTLRNSKDLRELTVWASAPAMVSLEAVQDRFREALKRAQRLFPFLAQKLVHLPMPLSMDTCFNETERRSACDRLQEASVEQYRTTTMYTDTRSPAVSLLMPHLGCHLPYPIGPMVAARQVISAMLPKKKRPQAAAEEGPRAPS